MRLSCLLPLLLPGVLAAQVVGPSTGGAVALAQADRMLGHSRRVLMIGAHPDDEDTDLLTLLVRGEGAEAAYLSLSRGEGGQNLIGPELGEYLGLIRTGELLAARRLDGARQYFTRAFDFGFSKTLDETARFWPRDSVLKDVVRIVRRFRPEVIVSVFSGTPRDGHGQHQMAGWVARAAFDASGDPVRFPELAVEEGLPPFAPTRLFRSSRFNAADTSLVLDSGGLDREVGQSYHQIAMRGRSLHRSQDMGVLQEPGPSPVRLVLVADRTGKADGTFWGAIDTTAAPLNGTGIETGDLRRHRDDAAANRAGLVVDAITDDGRLIPGQSVTVLLRVWNGGDRRSTASFELSAPAGWTVSPCPQRDVEVKPGSVVSCSMSVSVPQDVRFTTPYFLRLPREGAMYRWAGPPAAWGEPFEPPPLRASVRLVPEGGAPLLQDREVMYRYRDQAVGEVRQPLLVVPRVDVKLEPAVRLWPTGSPAPQPFTVTLQHGGAGRTTGTVTLELPPGWPEVAAQRFTLGRDEEREALIYQVRPPAALAPGSYEIRAVARDEAGHRYDTGMFTVEYPHIRLAAVARPAEAVVRAAPLGMPAVAHIGYIRGASDRVPEALREVGLPVEMLDAATLERGDLSRYDVIVVGSRAYETDPALGENNARLLEYARAGGRVLVQYQQQPYFNGKYAPAPLTVGSPHDRVTDEAAPMVPLRPTSPLFNRPNRIGSSDWEGWVQERGLYFARTWDPRYTPLLESADPGEPLLRGGLLVTAVGRGTYIYTGLAFFRQLPAGVPGAFRLFLNLLELRAPAPQS